MNREDLIALLDGELSPAEQETLERELPTDPAAFALLRELCRQRLMLAQVWAVPASVKSDPRPRFRLRWQVLAATLLFAASVTAVWLGRDADLRVVHGTVLVAGRPVGSVTVGALLNNPGPSSAEIQFRESGTLTLLPSTRAVLRRAREVVELQRGGAIVRVPGRTAEVRVSTRYGTMRVRGSEFSVELVLGPDKGGQSMESLLALVVSALLGQVQVEASGRMQVVAAGESRVFGADGAGADTLAHFLAAQDEKEKEKKDDEKKGKKKEKKEGKEKKEKEDDDDKDEKGGKGKKDKDDDDKDEKGGKEKEKRKKD